MAYVSLLFYLLAFISTLLFLGRCLAYGLERLVPLSLPGSWGKIDIRVRPVQLLRLQGLQVTLEESVIRVLALKDICLFREPEWYRTCARWIFEGSFPIAVQGIHLTLRADCLTQMLSSGPAIGKEQPTKKKRKRSIKLSTWAWKMLFRLLSRILVNISDVQIVLEDAGVKMKLEHLAVLFKSEKNIPCRAALKAKSLTIEVEKGQNEGDQVFQCFDLSDIAATAVVNCEKNSGPRLDSLKVALGTIQATIHQALLEDGIRCLQSLPQNIASPKVSSPKRPNKRATASFLPRKIGCGIHKLNVSYRDADDVSALNASVSLSHLHTGLESDTALEHWNVEGGIQRIDVRLGTSPESTEAFHLKIPTIRMDGRLVRDQERPQLQGKFEMGAVRASVDDCSIWTWIRSLQDRIVSWKALAQRPEEVLEATPEPFQNTKPSRIDAGIETVSSHEESVSDSMDLDRSQRGVLDSRDMGLIEEAEEEEPIEEVVILEPPPSPDPKPDLITKMIWADWDLSFFIHEGVTATVIHESKESLLMQFSTERVKGHAELQKAAEKDAHDCTVSGSIRNIKLQVPSKLLPKNAELMADVFTLKRIACSTHGFFKVITAHHEMKGQTPSVLCLSCHAAVTDIILSLDAKRLRRMMETAASVHHQLQDYRKSSSPKPQSMYPSTKKTKPLTVQFEKWSAEATGIRVVYDMELKPVQRHCHANTLPFECSLMLQLTGIEASSLSRFGDCEIHVRSFTAGWTSPEASLSFLKMTQLHMSLEKQHSVLSMGMQSASTHVEAEVDIAIVVMQLVEDATHLKNKAQDLFDLNSRQETRTTTPKSVCAASSTTPVKVRVPNSAQRLMQNFRPDIRLAKLNAKIRVADCDTLSIALAKVAIRTENTLPRIQMEHFSVDMNRQRIAECSYVNLRIVGPCYLSELTRTSSFGSRPRRMKQHVQHDNSLHVALDTDETEGNDQMCKIPEGRGRGTQMHQWRMKGCACMGIAENVEEDYVGTGNVLDFFSVDIEVDTASLIVPHDEHIGRLILFAELWTEAIKDLIKDKMSEIHASVGKDGKPSGEEQSLKEGPADLIEIRLSAKHVVFRLDAHPMEAWLSLHRQQLTEAVTLRHTWENFVRNLQEDFDSRAEAIAATQWASQTVFSEYIQSCRHLHQQQRDPLFHQGAWMCIVAENVDGLVLVGDRKSPAIVQSTIERIKELDHPTSDEITFARVQPIYIAAIASNIQGHFNGVEKSSAVIEKVDFGGLIARGRQLTHHPKTYIETYKVGRWHHVKKETPLKGARPPMKVYTDMKAFVKKLDANGGIGLEPVFCELSKAFNRLIPPSQVNNDGTLPSFSGHTLQSWDKIRYTWRGTMSVEIHQLAAAVAADTSSFADIQTPRLELQADRLEANVMAGGIQVNADDLAITLFNPGLRAAPEAPLRDFQLCSWPHASFNILYTWLMPQERSPLLHHAFPVVHTPDPLIRLDPVDLFQLFVGEGYTLEIHADFDQDRLPEDPVPKIMLGEEQIRFLVRFFQFMESAPTRIRGCWKKGTYYVKKDKRKKCITPDLPNLLHRIRTSLKTSKLAVEHHVWESEDPSDRLLIACDNVSFNGTWAFLNKIEDANALREGRFVKVSRYQEVDGVWRQVKGKNQLPDMEDLAVAAQNVEAILPETHTVHPILTREPPSDVDLDLFRLLTSDLIKSEEQEELKPPDGTKGRILTAKTFKLKQQSPRARRTATSADPDELQVVMPTGEIKRPLHIRLADVKLIMPLEVRNAVMGVYTHMLSAFTGPPRPASFKEKIADSIPPEQLQERQQKEEDAPVIKSTDSQLLKLLLEQNEQGRGPSLDNKRSPSVDEQHKVDPLPKRLSHHLHVTCHWTERCVESKMILQMEFDNVQLSCLSSVSMGGVLVCLQSGVLHEYFSEEEQIRTMTLQLRQVQAFHTDTKIDPMNPVRWLDRVNGALVIPSDSQHILTRILQPFEAELSDLHLMMLAQARNPGRAAEELKIHSSRIEALTDAEQFETLIDVINSLATPPPPDIKLLRDTILGPTGSALEDTSEAISEAKDALRETYRGFNDLRQQAYELMLIAAPEFVQPISFEETSRVKAIEFLRQAPSKKTSVGCRRHIPFVQDTLDEQIEVARKICYQATCTLRELSGHVAATNKHKKLYKSMKTQLAIDNVAWRLVNKETEFMLAEIKRVLCRSFQNKDLSGESSLSVYRIELRDARSTVGPGSGLDSGVVLSVLEPTGSDEEVLRGLAIRGTQTSSHVYYDHIEAWVHRFGLNFNEAMATELAGFFFPGTDDEIVRKREEDWARFGDNRRDIDPESEPPDKGLRRESGTQTSPESRSRASSFLEPLVVNTTPDRSHRFAFSNVPVTPPEKDPLHLSNSSTPDRAKKRRKKGLVKPRKTFFVHVRFNKIVTHMTYVGRPFSFKGLTITLGMSEYNHLEGNWRGLFKKYRNGVIGSVIKSIATHEGRSYDPSHVILGNASREEKKSPGSRLFRRGKQLFKRKEKTSDEPSEEEDEELNVDVVDEKAEQAGRDLLLGKM